MNPSAQVPNVFDMNSLSALKGAAKQDDPKALKAAAQQFEALFMQMVLKSMRDATPRAGTFDSEQTRLYEQLLDQQLGQVLSSKGSLGLAAMIEKQLTRNNAAPQLFEDGLPLLPETPSFPLDRGQRALPLDRSSETTRYFGLQDTLPFSGGSGRDGVGSQEAREFINRIRPYAEDAARATGIPAPFLMAQAALETGWGRSEPRAADGRPSHNLFGIKAGRNWGGASVEAATTEYVDGQPRRQTERFRAYGSYGDAFRDYASLLAASPRYAGLIGTQDSAAFARGLQRAGYATDPAYASKLERIIGGDTLRTALAG